MPLKTLVVDDQATVRRNLKLRFARLGCEVAEAENASRAWAIFQDFRPDFVTLDIIMPNRDGFTALDLLRKIRGTTQDTEVVVISSKPDKREEFLKEGAIEFISKPFESFERLISKLQPLIEVLDKGTQDSSDGPVRVRRKRATAPAG